MQLLFYIMIIIFFSFATKSIFGPLERLKKEYSNVWERWEDEYRTHQCASYAVALRNLDFVANKGLKKAGMNKLLKQVSTEVARIDKIKCSGSNQYEFNIFKENQRARYGHQPNFSYHLYRKKELSN